MSSQIYRHRVYDGSSGILLSDIVNYIQNDTNI